jgi:hypothetical protein
LDRAFKFSFPHFGSKGMAHGCMPLSDSLMSDTERMLRATQGESSMPTRTKQKTASKAKPKRVHISFEKEPWYAAAAQRFSAVRPKNPSR